MSKAKKVKQQDPPTPYRRTFETYRRVGDWEEGTLTMKAPSCFNGVVSIRRYRVTVEEIEEPVGVLEARLRKLWVECKNHHEWQPLQNEARRLGITLSHDERRR